MNEFRLTSPFQFEIKGTGENEEIFVKGGISNTLPDLVNDIVTLNCLKDVEEQIKNRNIKIDIEHEAFRGNNTEEKEINKTIVPVGRLIEPEILKKEDNYFLNIKGILNKFSKRYHEVKNSIKNRFLDAFSIAFIPEKVKFFKKDGKIYRALEKIKLLNVAFTGNPINTDTQIDDIITKAMDSTKEFIYEDPELKKYLEERNKNPELSEELIVKAREVDGYESPEPGDIPEKGKKILAKVYAECRKDGNSKEKCSKIAWDAVKEAGIKLDKKDIETKPFAGFENFNACVIAQKEKGKSEESAKKICGALQEGKSVEADILEIKDELEKIKKSHSSSFKDDNKNIERRLDKVNMSENLENGGKVEENKTEEKSENLSDIKLEVKNIHSELNSVKESINSLTELFKNNANDMSKTNHKAISQNLKSFEELNPIQMKRLGPLSMIR